MSNSTLLNGSRSNYNIDRGISVSTFLASLATGAVVFAIEALLFLMLKGKLRRIYQPRTYLVPDRERTKEPAPGLLGWVLAVFQTTNAEFIQKCGLDAYFFLRYLRMLLKIFVPLGLVILPILIPINKVGGKDNNMVSNANSTTWNVTGLDQLAWGNVKPTNTDRYWAHLVLAVLSIIYVCAVFFDELRGYIRLRQAYLTSPQHRLRASATTVLVTAIPRKWLTVEALTNLYDVFPGGIRNIWINRQLDELNEKVKLRDKLALTLEAAETNLIAKCKKAHLKKVKAEAKKNGKKVTAEAEKEREETDRKAAEMAMQSGISSGDPHQVAHNVHDAVKKDRKEAKDAARRQRKMKFIPLVGGINAVGNGTTVLEKKVVSGLRKANQGVEQRLNATPGFAIIPEQSASTYRGRVDEDVNDPENYPRFSLNSNPDSVISNPEEGNQEIFYDGPIDNHNASRPGWSRKSSSNSKHGHRAPEADEIPLTEIETRDSEGNAIRQNTNGGSAAHKKKDGHEYPVAYNEDWQEHCGEPLWTKYIKKKDRETMRLPIFGISWMPSIPLIGMKVDTIDYCRKEVARLNLEIEIDQKHPEKFPLMNSAFIQFNHQVAAHMACQSVSHHVPKQMAPRVVEISPDDVIWDNMSMKWWERYLRAGGIFIVVCGMVAGWAIPVAFTGLLSQLSYLEGKFSWLRWLASLPHWLFSAIQGVLPPLFLSLLMILLPLILRFLSRTQGLQTGMAVELMVSNYYFAFLFVQLFLVVAISSSFTTLVDSFTNITGWPELLAQNIPKSSNYFFSYMILQAMSVSAGALAQIISLVQWFILGPLFDNTARNKWSRTTNLSTVQWGTFFPVYTTLACIGLIYLIVAPLIVLFVIATFSLFWFVYRYNTLYVTTFRFDTGGLLFPKAINQLFTGLYVMELCLIGLFFLVRNEYNQVVCQGQAIVMIVVLLLTIGYQFFLNEAFSPLIRYLPITLEDDAVRRDEEFARAQRIRHGMPLEEDEYDIHDGPASEYRQSENDEQDLDDKRKDVELQDIERDSEDGGGRATKNSLRRNMKQVGQRVGGAMNPVSWADRSRNRRSKYYGSNTGYDVPSIQKLRQQLTYEAEDEEMRGTGVNAVGRALFAGIHDELEDLTPDERDQLVQRAFQHEALRAKRPVIWIPRDELGVSDDEIYCTQRLSKHLWISNEYQALDSKCRTIFSRSPPDFSEVDLIQL